MIRRFFYRVELPGLSTRTVCRLALLPAAQLARFSVAHFLPESSILYTLIGDAVIEIPAPIVSRLERALSTAGMRPHEALFLTRLAEAHYPLGSNGAPWEEEDLSPERNEALAQVSRNLGGLSTVLQVLWAGLAHNRTPGSQGRVADHVLQGLAQASRELAEGASEALHAPPR